MGTQGRDSLQRQQSASTFPTQPIEQQKNRGKHPVIDDSTKIKLLMKLLTASSSSSSSSSSTPLYTSSQIEEFIISYKPVLSMPDETTGILPLRAAIRSDRRDLVCLLLRHGASPGDSDREGMVIREVMASSKPGSLALLTDLLETCDTKILRNLLNNGNGMCVAVSSRD